MAQGLIHRFPIKSLLEKFAFVAIHYLLICAVSSSYAKWAVNQAQNPPPLWRAYYIFYGIYAFIVMVVVNASYTILYIGKFKSIEKYKIQPGPWPWEGKSFFTPENVSSIKNVLFSILVVINTLSILFVTTIKPDMRPETAPTLLQHLGCVVVNLFCEDFFFYFSHLVLHTPWFYRKIHKKHHEPQQITCFTTLDNHWFETMISGLTTFSGSWILGKRQHFVSMMVFTSVRVWESDDVHSGYRLPFSIFNLAPFMVDPPYHNFHHSHNIGNYSMTLKLWDRFLGTHKPYQEFLNKKKLEEKEHSDIYE